MSKFLKSLFFVFVAVNVWAQMPHEVLLLVNELSQDSLKVANAFAAARQIPPQNIVYLNVPERVYGGTATVTPDEFSTLIWEPANALVAARGLESRILAWVYSVDFPIRVKTDVLDRKQLSVGGLTFLRNQVPDLKQVEEGSYRSKLFAGPNAQMKLSLRGLSLGTYKVGVGESANVPAAVAYLKGGLRDQMPLPSMMLGYTGEKGSDVQTVLDCIARGKQSDGRGGRAGIYFLMSDNIRSTCRDWQFSPAVNELKHRGIVANMSTNFPAGKMQVMGVMMGAETVDPSLVGSFAPGAMAEHLTSWGAEFQRPQTKLTAWIDAGATGSAGSVVEPYANPNKFPAARFFVHYAAGCSMLESFYQSIACPLQHLLIGDPLARPYAVPLRLKVLGPDVVKTSFTYMVQAECQIKDTQIQYAYFLDGHAVGRGFSEDPSVRIDVDSLSDGYHELRVGVRLRHSVDFSASLNRAITVDRLGRSVSISADIRKLAKHVHGIKVLVKGEEQPETVRLVAGERVLDEDVFDPAGLLVLKELMLGEGPNRVRVVAVYADGMEVSSAPISFGIKFAQ